MHERFEMVRNTIAAYGIRRWWGRRRWWNRDRANVEALSRWLSSHGGLLADQEIQSVRKAIEEFRLLPTISVVMPVYDVDERCLRLAIESVMNQVYQKWELCIADDCSPSPHVRAVLNEYASKDDRIKVVFRDTNGHISAASNSALDLATGEFTALLDHDDELTEDALFHVVAAINDDPTLEMIYSDEDVVDERGERYAPKLKPDWSRDLFYSVNYVTHFAVYRTAVLRKIGGFRIGFEGSQDYDLALRTLEEIGDEAIGHIPHILYHWRAIRGSVALSGDEKPYAHERGRAAIREHFARTSVLAEVVESDFDLHRVIYRLPESRTSVSFVVSGGGEFSGDAELDGEVIFVEPSAESRAESLNRAVSRTSGEILIFLDGDLKLDRREGIDELVAAALQPEIGAVGGRIVGTDSIVEQAGVVLNSDLSPALAHHGYPREAPGNLFRNRQIGNFSALTVACMVIRRVTFEELGGFDHGAFPNNL
ncbi:MAG: glycosyltransferase, partial [Blastocatellia bacterium]|nr:glycosyltransferase [Blastocatellia bacterium]